MDCHGLRPRNDGGYLSLRGAAFSREELATWRDVAIWGHLDDGGSGENDGGAALGFGAGGFAHDDLDVVA